MNGRDLANRGMQSSHAVADEKWKYEATWAVYDIAYEAREFTTDDVWNLLTMRGFDTHERRALGAIMQRAIRARLIKRSGRWTESTRPEAHNGPKPIYNSLIVGEIPRKKRLA